MIGGETYTVRVKVRGLKKIKRATKALKRLLKLQRKAAR